MDIYRRGCFSDNFTDLYTVGNRPFTGPGYAPDMGDRQASQNRKHAALVAGVMALGSAGMALSGAPASSMASPPLERASDTATELPSITAGRLFASRHRRTVQPWEETSIGAEMRPSSPLPYAGDLFPPEPEVVSAPPPMPEQEVHVLTSFDGTRTMTSGDASPQVYSRHLPERERSVAQNGPVRWNNPMQWLGTHER